MIEYTPEASRQVDELLQHYGTLERERAAEGLLAALEAAEQRLTDNPGIGLPAPRPYPALARPGRLWIKSGRYWIAYRPSHAPVIIGVFYETADIPRRS